MDDPDARLAAVERTLTDSECAPGVLADETLLQRRLTAVEQRLDRIEPRVADTTADIEAVRSHLGDAQRVDRETEAVAQRALAVARETRGCVETRRSSVSVRDRLRECYRRVKTHLPW